MNNPILFSDFFNKVLISSERVHFSHVDPYGHLNTSRYIEFFLNHRIHAAEEQIKCYTMDIVKELSLGFVVRDLNVRFVSPSFQGEVLEIASWVRLVTEQSFELSLVAASLAKRHAKAVARIEFVSVDMKTGRPTKIPNSLPSRSSDNPISRLPSSSTYLATISGLPVDFL